MHQRNTLYFLFYRFRFLILYIVFGVLALTVDLMIGRSLQSFGIEPPFSSFIGFIGGLFVAFVLNIRFNFHIAPPKRKRVLIYFTVISFISFCIQLLFRQELVMNSPQSIHNNTGGGEASVQVARMSGPSSGGNVKRKVNNNPIEKQ